MKPRFSSVVLCVILLGISVTASFGQKNIAGVDGISEPPELTGEPKKVTKASEADKAIFDIVGHLNDEKEAASALENLNQFITENPNYSDAYFLRATALACILDRRNFSAITNDVEAAMSHPDRAIYNTTDYYSLLAKVKFAATQYKDTINDLEKAMSRDFSAADRMFNIEGVEPQKTSKFCIWNLTDLDTLAATFPQDYRPRLFRGLYYKFFTTFKETYYEKAMQEFQRAAVLNPKSPVPQYFIGQVHTKSSFWTKKAWSSDANRDDAVRSAVQPYTNAIQLDSKFLPAYEQRASAYLNLKQYPKAIKDYDSVLELDPGNTTAYSDRGIAKLEMSNYAAAIGDLQEAIRLKKEGDSFLPELNEYLGDAHAKLGDYKDAVADYSKAIERRLANDSFLFSLKQIRDLYPEYDGVSDEVLCRKINALFWPEFEYSVVAKRLMQENGKWSISFLFSELYEKRGDTYLKSSDYRRGVLDFQRIFKGIPSFADSTDRWRLLGATSDGKKYYLDAKTAEFSINASAQFWVKTVGKKEATTIAYEIDCKGRRISNTSVVTYDPNGKVLNTSEIGSGWQVIVPETIGEQLYNGACSR
jgi:tetratricopeptide (TPR) repeat protein